MSKFFWAFMGVIVLVYLGSRWARSDYAAPQFPSMSCSAPSMTPGGNRQAACRRACEVIDECGYYMTNEADRVMSVDDCERFCTFLPDGAWAECTLRYHSERGCCGKQFGECATHLPDPPQPGGEHHGNR